MLNTQGQYTPTQGSLKEQLCQGITESTEIITVAVNYDLTNIFSPLMKLMFLTMLKTKCMIIFFLILILRHKRL